MNWGLLGAGIASYDEQNLSHAKARIERNRKLADMQAARDAQLEAQQGEVTDAMTQRKRMLASNALLLGGVDMPLGGEV